MNAYVWVVSCIYMGRPMVTVFNNQQAATKCEEYFKEAGYKNVEVDYAEVYSHFYWKKD